MDHQHIQADLAGPAKALRAEIPEVMGAFARLSRSAMAEGELTTATKELIALAISGWLGGMLAYRFGIRVASEADQAVGVTAAPIPSHDLESPDVDPVGHDAPQHWS